MMTPLIIHHKLSMASSNPLNIYRSPKPPSYVECLQLDIFQKLNI